MPQLAAVHQQMGQLLAALLSSRRANATELEIRLAASEAAAREHQRVIERLTSMLATKEQRIEKLGSFMEQHSEFIARHDPSTGDYAAVRSSRRSRGAPVE